MCSARTFAFVFALIACAQGSPSRAAESDLRRQVLDALLAMENMGGRQGKSLIIAHGPILPEEIAYLVSKATSGSKTVRQNATTLLGIARDADDALRQVAAKSDDEGVVMLALEPILHKPGAGALAAERKDAIQRALKEGGRIAAIALHAGYHAGLPDMTDEIRKRLADPSREVRKAATEVLAEGGAGALEADVSAIVLDPKRRREYILSDLYKSLMHSDNPSIATVLLQSLNGADQDVEIDFLNAVLLSDSRKPWLRQLLLDMASHENKLQWDAFDRLERWGAEAPTRELVKICSNALQVRLASNTPPPRGAEDIEACRKFLGTLAGRTFMFEDLRDARAFASQWLAAH